MQYKLIVVNDFQNPKENCLSTENTENSRKLFDSLLESSTAFNRRETRHPRRSPMLSCIKQKCNEKNTRIFHLRYTFSRILDTLSPLAHIKYSSKYFCSQYRHVDDKKKKKTRVHRFRLREDKLNSRIFDPREEVSRGKISRFDVGQ